MANILDVADLRETKAQDALLGFYPTKISVQVLTTWVLSNHVLGTP